MQFDGFIQTMFIGHLPAGYILSSFFRNKAAQIAILVGSILPDLDLFYFYTIGQRAVVHHMYWTHMPFFWIGICLVLWVILKIFKPEMTLIAAALFVGTILHLALDTIAGGIFWLMPFYDHDLVLVTVPARHSHWLLNFFLHWTFALEILVCLIAGCLLLKRRNKEPVHVEK